METHLTVHDEFEYDNVTPEKLIFDFPRTLLVQFVDIQQRKVELKFTNLVALKMINVEYVDYGSIMVEKNLVFKQVKESNVSLSEKIQILQSKRLFPKKLLEVHPVQWDSHYTTVDSQELVSRLKKELIIRHFLLPFRDRVFEVLAGNFVFEVLT